MPRKTSKPGTERFRDEQRAGGPRMHGGRWHDSNASEQRSLEPASEAAPDALPEAEAGGGRVGMHRGLTRKTKGLSRKLSPSRTAKGQPGTSRR